MWRHSIFCFVDVLLLASLAHSHDYVVIGGGTGGLTVAGRLSENPSVTVAVIEAGPNAEDIPEVFIPGLAGSAPASINWQYATVPQTNLNGRNLTVNAGKALGGSTVINSVIFANVSLKPQAERRQYDVWGQLNHDDTWTSNGLLPYFKKSEVLSPPNANQIKNGVNGFHGNVKVGFPNFYSIQSTLWERAAVTLGFPLSPDFENGSPHAVGVAPDSLNAANNTRCSAACAYFIPVANRPNLIVLLNSSVSRIIWKNQTLGDKLVASAVEYVKGGEIFTVPVRREVILAAGTIDFCPRILSAAGVKTVLNLSTVGENLADHVHGWVNSFTNISLAELECYLATEQRLLWFKNRTGILSAGPRALGIAAPSDIFNSSKLKSFVRRARMTLPQFVTLELAKGIQAQHEFALSLYERNKELPLELNLGM